MHLGQEERGLLSRLLGELREVVTDEDAGDMARRLFPVVHPDHPDREAEYQRLMREELVASHLGALASVDEVCSGRGAPSRWTTPRWRRSCRPSTPCAWCWAPLLDVTEDDDIEQPGRRASSQFQLYAYLSWVLDSAIRELSDGVTPPPPSGRARSSAGRGRPIERLRARSSEDGLVEGSGLAANVSVLSTGCGTCPHRLAA